MNRSLIAILWLVLALGLWALAACVPPAPPSSPATVTPETGVAGLAATPIPAASTGEISEVSAWRVHRHENLGVEVRYPPTWQVDSQEWFVWFNSDSHSSQGFNIANANFGMTTPDEFLDHLEIPVEMTRTVTLDGQRALFVGLQPVPEAQGYRSVVAIVTPYGENLTVGNRGDSAVFRQALATLRFFEPAHARSGR